jgi:hypothetical protein
MTQTHASELHHHAPTPIAQTGVVNTVNNICVNNKALLAYPTIKPTRGLIGR